MTRCQSCEMPATHVGRPCGHFAFCDACFAACGGRGRCGLCDYSFWDCLPVFPKPNSNVLGLRGKLALWTGPSVWDSSLKRLVLSEGAQVGIAGSTADSYYVRCSTRREPLRVPPLGGLFPLKLCFSNDQLPVIEEDVTEPVYDRNICTVCLERADGAGNCGHLFCLKCWSRCRDGPCPVCKSGVEWFQKVVFPFEAGETFVYLGPARVLGGHIIYHGDVGAPLRRLKESLELRIRGRVMEVPSEWLWEGQPPSLKCAFLVGEEALWDGQPCFGGPEGIVRRGHRARLVGIATSEGGVDGMYVHFDGHQNAAMMPFEELERFRRDDSRKRSRYA